MNGSLKYIYLSIVVLATMIVPTPSSATPVSTASAKIIMLRPYLNGSVYVHLDANILCGTSVFVIAADNDGKDVMYSAVLAAFMAGKRIQVEALTTTGCNGWGTSLQSLYVLE